MKTFPTDMLEIPRGEFFPLWNKLENINNSKIFCDLPFTKQGNSGEMNWQRCLTTQSLIYAFIKYLFVNLQALFTWNGNRSQANVVFFLRSGFVFELIGSTGKYYKDLKLLIGNQSKTLQTTTFHEQLNLGISCQQV